MTKYMVHKQYRAQTASPRTSTVKSTTQFGKSSGTDFSIYVVPQTAVKDEEINLDITVRVPCLASTQKQADLESNITERLSKKTK